MKSTYVNDLSLDLLACTKRQGYRAALSAYLFEPGFHFLVWHRLSVLLYSFNFKRLGKIVWKYNSVKYGCYFHIEASISGGVYLPHPTAIVVGAGTVVGPGVTIYQGVTLGRGVREGSYPTIGADVVLYANSIVIGKILVAEKAIVGAGAIVTKAVLEGAVVAGNPARPLN